GGLNVEGNYWAPFHKTSGLDVIPANPCADGSCMVTLTMALQGEGSGTVGMVHNSAADLGYTAIFNTLAALNYGGINTAEGHFESMIGGSEYAWQIPSGMRVTFAANASSGSGFHGWTGDSGFTGTSSPLNVTIPGANLAPPTSVPYDPITVEAGASFWPAATGLAFSGANAVVAGQVSTAITLSVVDGDGGPTRLTQSTTYTLSSTGFAKFYSD